MNLCQIATRRLLINDYVCKSRQIWKPSEWTIDSNGSIILDVRIWNAISVYVTENRIDMLDSISNMSFFNWISFCFCKLMFFFSSHSIQWILLLDLECYQLNWFFTSARCEVGCQHFNSLRMILSNIFNKVLPWKMHSKIYRTGRL